MGPPLTSSGLQQAPDRCLSLLGVGGLDLLDIVGLTDPGPGSGLQDE